MKLGMVTYMWGAEWDLPTVIRNCSETGFSGVELRSTHKHGVEVSLNREQRAEVLMRFADSNVELVGLGSACEYHSNDPEVLKQNIELTKEFLVLSHDIGSTGVKVRPNGMVKGKDRKGTAEQIGTALNECGEFAAGYGQEVRVEIHGRETSEPAFIKEIMAVATHPHVAVCWNCNPIDVVDGSMTANFKLIEDRLGHTVHIHDLFDTKYPYREFFSLLRSVGYDGYCLSESPATSDPLRVMNYYRALWLELIKPD
jgi:sugar phosphate isomerase/epimerase